jgi:hypothetical protein
MRYILHHFSITGETRMSASAATFPFEDCDFDHGDVCIGGVDLIEIETQDGVDFTIIDIIASKRSQTMPWLVMGVTDWVCGDLARPRGQSRIRKAYQNHIAGREDCDAADAAAAAADMAHDMRLNAAAA